MEVLPFGLLVFVGATLVFVQVWGIIDAKFAVSAAAREAVRVYVESDTEGAAIVHAEQRARDTLAAYGRTPERAGVVTELSDPFGRCTRVTVTVSYAIPAIVIPWIGGFGSITPVESTHSEIIDPFRSALAGAATC